jgi:hypothetical protein
MASLNSLVVRFCSYKAKLYGVGGGLARGGVVLITSALVAGCTAFYPEISTPLKPIPPGEELDPPPPKDILYIAVTGASIPKLTRDGRRWDDVGNGAPDALAVVFIGDEELLRTPVQSNTFNPTWPRAVRQNYKVPVGSSLRVELWEENPIVNHPICTKELKSPQEPESMGEIELSCLTGGSIKLLIEPAKARFGLGLYYELRANSVAVTRTLPLSPAERAGLRRGDEILSIAGKPVKGLSEAQIRTAINVNSPRGVKLRVKTSSGQKDVELKDGPIYSLKDPELDLNG